ncbi:MAG: hopanoid biosynthesis associated radical SAM protein HpnJ [Candidatus Acidiferrales bacterium]
MKTLLLNPPSFENFDGGASSRWPATREIESYWYPVWLTYPAGLIPGSRLLDASPHKVNWRQTVEICKDYEFLVLYTSTVGFESDIKLLRKIKEANRSLKVAFVGPHGHIRPEETLNASEDIDFIVRGEFDHAVVEYACGKPLEQILGASFRKDGRIVHNAPRPQLHTEELDALPFSTDVYKRDLQIERYNVPFLLHPFVAFYSSRGCPALCTFCMWPQTISGHAWRVRSVDNVVREVKNALQHFPQMKEIFFDDDTFNIRKDRAIELSQKFKPLKFQWSCTARCHSKYEELKAMADGGARLFIVGFESGDPQILKNVKKGATVEMAREFMKNCRKVGIKVHGDFIIGLPGETKETIERTIEFAKELDCETIQVSLAHALPGTEFHDQMSKQGLLRAEALADSGGHQLPHIEYPHLSKAEMMAGVSRFYDEYYFRPRVAWRIVREALWDSYERKRLYHEAVDFLKLRAERAKWARRGETPKTTVSVLGTSPASSND